MEKNKNSQRIQQAGHIEWEWEIKRKRQFQICVHDLKCMSYEWVAAVAVKSQWKLREIKVTGSFEIENSSEFDCTRLCSEWFLNKKALEIAFVYDTSWC